MRPCGQEQRYKMLIKKTALCAVSECRESVAGAFVSATLFFSEFLWIILFPIWVLTFRTDRFLIKIVKKLVKIYKIFIDISKILCYFIVSYYIEREKEDLLWKRKTN